MPDFEPRRAKPGDRFTVTGSDGRQLDFKADEDGVVHPSNHEEAGLLDSMDLPVARKALAESQAAEAADDKPAAKGGK